MFNDVSSTNFYASKDLYGAYFSPKNQLHAKNKLQTKEKNYFKYGVTSFDKAKKYNEYQSQGHYNECFWQLDCRNFDAFK